MLLTRTQAAILLGATLLMPLLPGNAHAREFISPVQQATLLELYTSEGCSSCPPADRWLSGFKQDPRLWQQLVPVAFHVDYWDYLGWRDRFSNARYSRRQYEYKTHGNLSVVYTPGLMQNGREFRNWRRASNVAAKSSQQPGVLQAQIENGKARAEFQPTGRINAPLTLNVALLGFDQSTQVASGENHGKLLRHDFVVLEFQQFSEKHTTDKHVWQFDQLIARQPANASGIALWVSAGTDPTPLQATGGWLQ